jgi:hypothetical protein
METDPTPAEAISGPEDTEVTAASTDDSTAPALRAPSTEALTRLEEELAELEAELATLEAGDGGDA